MPITRIPPSEPNARASAVREEETFFRNLLEKWADYGGRRHRLEFRLGEDSDGSPAIWITIFSRDSVNPSTETRQEIDQMSDAIRKEIINSDFERWPYFRIKAG
jgi:hypothetical protein